MRTYGLIFILVFCLAAVIPASEAQDAYKRMLDDPRVFTGPTGSVIAPSSLDSIPIGLFAPTDQMDRAAHDLYRGIVLAVEQANARGGYRGVDFRLVRRWAADPWAAGSIEVVRFVYWDRVWAVIAYRGGADHIAQQIAAKAHVPVIAPISSSSSLTRAGVPWIFRLTPDDKSQARVLVTQGIGARHLHRVGMVSSTDHDSRAAAGEIEKELYRHNASLLFHFEVPPGLPGLQGIVERIRDFRPGVLVLCTRAAAIPGLVKTLRDKGMDCPLCMPWTPGLDTEPLPAIYKGPLYFVEPFQPPARAKTGETYCRFSREYEKRYGTQPTCSAAYGYDAAQIIILSIRSKGLNRAAIRQALEELTGYKGVTGPLQWDNGGSNQARPVIKELR